MDKWAPLMTGESSGGLYKTYFETFCKMYRKTHVPEFLF